MVGGGRRARKAPAPAARRRSTAGPAHIFTGNGQTYIRDTQKELVPRMIAVAGHRWHNSVNRDTMIQILRYLTIRKGGVYSH